jgi:hypothetical protein
MQGARRGGRRSHGARTATRTDAVAGGLFVSVGYCWPCPALREVANTTLKYSVL